MTEPDIVERQLALTRRALTPSAALAARVHARLAVESAAAGVSGLGATPVAVPSSPWRSLRASGRAGALLGAGLLVLGFAGGYLARGGDAAEPPPLPVAPVAELPASLAPSLPIADEEPMPLASAVAAEVEQKRPTAPHTARKTRAADLSPRATAPSAQSPRDELLLLQRAERAVRAGSAALALSLIAELEEHHPRSLLLEERRAIELMAHCDAKATDASERAARFLREHPQSVYAGRIGTMCWVEPPVSEPAAP